MIGALRRDGQSLADLHDRYTGATAQREQRPVLTSNGDRFERMPEVDVIDWESY